MGKVCPPPGREPSGRRAERGGGGAAAEEVEVEQGSDDDASTVSLSNACSADVAAASAPLSLAAEWSPRRSDIPTREREERKSALEEKRELLLERFRSPEK